MTHPILKISDNIFKYAAPSMHILKKNLVFPKSLVRVPTYKILNFTFSESLLPGGSFGAGIVACIQNLTWVPFWSSVGGRSLRMLVTRKYIHQLVRIAADAAFLVFSVIPAVKPTG